MTQRADARPLAGDGLLQPAALLAIAVLIFNDHWLKAVAPGWWTGKLSDFAGLLFFPLLLQAASEWLSATRGAWRAPSHRALLVAALMTSVVFVLIQVWLPAADAYRYGLGVLQWPVLAVIHGASAPIAVALTPDPTDLIALPAVAVAVALGWRRCPY